MSHGKTYEDVCNAFAQGTVVNASKRELEELLLAVGQSRVLHPANQARAAEMGETMRQLLAARQGEEAHTQAMGVAKLALWVSLAALAASVIQAVAALNIVAPMRSPLFEFQSTSTAVPPVAAASRGK